MRLVYLAYRSTISRTFVSQRISISHASQMNRLIPVHIIIELFDRVNMVKKLDTFTIFQTFEDASLITTYLRPRVVSVRAGGERRRIRRREPTGDGTEEGGVGHRH
jgi:hypothetical protein